MVAEARLTSLDESLDAKFDLSFTPTHSFQQKKMATFSPSPAPRRTSRKITPRPAGNSPPITARRTRLGNSKSTSRLGTPQQTMIPTAPERLPPIAGDDFDSSILSEFDMDVDEAGNSSVTHIPSKPETLFAKSNELSVAFYANLPAEVKQVLKNAGEYA